MFIRYQKNKNLTHQFYQTNLKKYNNEQYHDAIHNTILFSLSTFLFHFLHYFVLSLSLSLCVKTFDLPFPTPKSASTEEMEGDEW